MPSPTPSNLLTDAPGQLEGVYEQTAFGFPQTSQQQLSGSTFVEEQEEGGRR